MYVLQRNDIEDFIRHARRTQEVKQSFSYSAAQKCRGGQKLFEICKGLGVMVPHKSPIPHIPVYYTFDLDSDDAELSKILWDNYRQTLSPKGRNMANGVKVTKRETTAAGVTDRLIRIERKLDQILSTQR